MPKIPNTKYEKKKKPIARVKDSKCERMGEEQIRKVNKKLLEIIGSWKQTRASLKLKHIHT